MNNSIKQIIPIFLCMFMVFSIHAQNNSTWKTIDTDKYSIKIPSDWTVNLDLPIRTKDSGLIINKQVYNTPQVRDKGGIYVDVIKYNHNKGITVSDIYEYDTLSIKEIFNGTCDKQVASPPCKLHYIFSYQYDNPYIKKMEYMKRHHWLYEQDKSVYSVIITYEKDVIKDFPDLSKIIDDIQKSFTLK